MPLTYGGKKLKLSVGTRPHPLSIALEFSVGQAGRGEIHRVAAGEYEIVSIPATNECVQVPAGGPWWKALCKMEQCNFGKDTCHKVDFVIQHKAPTCACFHPSTGSYYTYTH